MLSFDFLVGIKNDLYYDCFHFVIKLSEDKLAKHCGVSTVVDIYNLITTYPILVQEKDLPDSCFFDLFIYVPILLKIK